VRKDGHCRHSPGELKKLATRDLHGAASPKSRLDLDYNTGLTAELEGQFGGTTPPGKSNGGSYQKQNPRWKGADLRRMAACLFSRAV